MRRMKLEALRRHLTVASLAVLLGAVLLSLSQCTMVGDNLTGVQIGTTASTSCAGVCRSEYRDAVSVERKRHSTQNEFCRSLEEPDRSTCLDQERAFFEANLDALQAQRDECLVGCHRQGSGTAG